jgi:hypothetical protein
MAAPNDPKLMKRRRLSFRSLFIGLVERTDVIKLEVAQESTRRPAAIDAEDLAGDVTAFGCHKKQDRVRNLLDSSGPIQGNVLEHAFGTLVEYGIITVK